MEAKEDNQNRYKHKHKHSLRDPRLLKVVEDPRFNLFKKEWFEAKNCLDIGLSNNGTLTIYIAQEFCCKSILGIDNDSGRVKNAILNHRKSFQSNLALVQTPVKASKLNDGFGASSNQHTPMEHSTLRLRNDLYDRVSFKEENLFQFFHSEYRNLKEPYDAIICLSTTHWIELNVQAADLISLFQKIQRLLKPDGVFVLEPKSLEPYGRNYYVPGPDTTLPEPFLKILLDKTGFKMVEQLDYRRLDIINSNRVTILVFKK